LTKAENQRTAGYFYQKPNWSSNDRTVKIVMLTAVNHMAPLPNFDVVKEGDDVRDHVSNRHGPSTIIKPSGTLQR
jgi:hypothetical protein